MIDRTAFLSFINLAEDFSEENLDQEGFEISSLGMIFLEKKDAKITHLGLIIDSIISSEKKRCDIFFDFYKTPSLLPISISQSVSERLIFTVFATGTEDLTDPACHTLTHIIDYARTKI